MKLVDGEEWLKGKEVIHRSDRNGGLLIRLDAGRVAKVFPYKGWLLGWARILRSSTKAHKQGRSMARLLELGIKTPKPLEVVSFVPKGGPFEGVLVYEYVEKVREVREELLEPTRGRVLERVADELAVMASAGVFFVDLHPGNILMSEELDLYWIDVEIVEGAAYVRKNFWPRVVRMRQKRNMELLSDEEWGAFCARIERGLPEGGGFSGKPEF